MIYKTKRYTVMVSHTRKFKITVIYLLHRPSASWKLSKSRDITEKVAILPNLTFYLIVQGSRRAYATGAACQQRTLTPPDTWSRPTLGLAYVLMSRPISS